MTQLAAVLVAVVMLAGVCVLGAVEWVVGKVRPEWVWGRR